MKARYSRELLREVEEHHWDWAPETVYIGGGTPSLMPIDELRRILRYIPLTQVSEFTLECAPGTVTLVAAEAWRSCGMNRLSLGVQSFVQPELRQTGRRHTAEIVVRDIETLRSANLSNINIDLIAGLPGQTRQSWEDSLDWIERLQPPHVSVYIFEIDEDSRLGKEALLGGIRYGADVLPANDVVADLYERAVERLRRMGIHRYEISNFAEPGYESAHNLKYWRLDPYVGFGLDAHSYDGYRRWANADELEAYFRRSMDRKVVQTERAEEHFFVGLRLTNGIEPTEDERLQFAEPIAKWTDAGMLEQRGRVLRLTDRGVLLSNEILQDFVGV